MDRVARVRRQRCDHRLLQRRLQRVGRCGHQFGDITALPLGTLEKMVDDLSSRVRPRLRKDGRVAVAPQDIEQVPLDEEDSVK